MAIRPVRTNSMMPKGRIISMKDSILRSWPDISIITISGATSTIRPRKISVNHARDLNRLLENGARACGYPTEIWSTSRVAALIEKRYLIQYHRSHVGRLLHGLGWIYERDSRGAPVGTGWVPGPARYSSWAFLRPR